MSDGQPYFIVGQTISDTFFYTDDSGEAVTGKVDGNFTKELEKDGAGNQSTTGITITEVDATNNAGLYAVSINGTTGFPATTGEYTLVATDSGDTDKKFRQVYRVANSNVFTGNTAEFTATSGDGRITDGSNPIADADIILQDSSGDTVTATTSDAAGVWGPVFLTETVTGYVQAENFAQNSFAITVSGTSATGPGSDVVLSAAATSNTLKASELVEYARRMAADRTGSKSDEVLFQCVNEALQYIAQRMGTEYYWDTFEITLEAPYETGTLAVTEGDATVTLSGGTWPANAIKGYVAIENKLYRISERTNDTVIELESDYPFDTDASVDSWRWIRTAYDLPSDVYRLNEPMYGRNWLWPTDPVPYPDLQKQIYAWQYSLTWASAFAVANGQIHLWPAPSEATIVAWSYYRRPAQLISLNATADCDPNSLELLRRAIDYHVCLRYAETEGGTTARQAEKQLEQALAQYTANDKTVVSRPSPTGRPGNGRYGRLPDGTWSAPLS